jgi:hypothetical protein
VHELNSSRSSEWGTVVGSYENSNEHSGFIKVSEFLNQLSD